MMLASLVWLLDDPLLLASLEVEAELELVEVTLLALSNACASCTLILPS